MDKYFRRIIFTKTPLKGTYRFGDLFQILPIVSDKAHKNIFAQDFPILLEYKIVLDQKQFEEFDADIITYSSFQQNIEKEYLSLLTVLTNHRFFSYSKNHHWGMTTPPNGFDELPQHEQDLYNNQYSSWIINVYSYPGLSEDLIISEFSQVDLPQVELKPQLSYFSHDPIDKSEGVISFPDTLTSCLVNYFKLTTKTRDKVKAALFLICDGIEIQDKMRSMAFLSFISSIESMLSFEYPEDGIEYSCKSCKSLSKSLFVCEQCGNPIWGIRRKFTDYLSKFVAGGAKSIKKYKKIYDIRCQIAHSGGLFLIDLEISFDDMEKKEKEWLMRIESLQLARISIVNWLNYDKKSSR
jgi:hypothetical protein